MARWPEKLSLLVSSHQMKTLSLKKREEKTHGNCKGPDTFYVKLISSDGHESILKREHVQTSAIKAMLSGPGQFAENKINEANFREILPNRLWKVCMYLPTRSTTLTTSEITKFPIAPEIALELLMAANFLDWSQK
ncbi:elongin-C-like [Chionomys nivalis]|uniref:elongin-C-like n=1 Tax=Chionomys nivalis TaxID=269649 RepID=UPI002596E8A0|nr:elongin-C-like [Chionomys nivalis]